MALVRCLIITSPEIVHGPLHPKKIRWVPEKSSRISPLFNGDLSLRLGECAEGDVCPLWRKDFGEPLRPLEKNDTTRISTPLGKA